MSVKVHKKCHNVKTDSGGNRTVHAYTSVGISYRHSTQIHYIISTTSLETDTLLTTLCATELVQNVHFLIRVFFLPLGIHFIVLCGVEQPKVELPLVCHCFPNSGYLLLDHVQRCVHRVVELQLILSRNTLDVQGVILCMTRNTSTVA